VIWPDGDALRSVSLFSTQVFRRLTIERLVAQFLYVVKALASPS
jgi:hypothetical protein